MTATELFAMPQDTAGVDRWLFAGRLVERRNANGFHTPAHSSAVLAVSYILSTWCHGTLRAFGYGCPYRLRRDPDTIVSFDASILRADDQIIIRSDSTHIEGAPLLAVEVTELDEDPDSLGQLVDASLEGGVELVWVVDPFKAIVVCHDRTGRPVFLDGRMDLVGGRTLPGFRCRVAEIFE